MQFHEIVAHTDKIAEMREFYAKQMGLPVAQGGAGIAITVGATRLIFQPGNSERYHFAFNIPENQLEAGAAWVQGFAPLLDVEPGIKVADFENWNAHAVYFLDPAGNILELIARHGLANASDEFALLEVSEVGMGVDDVPGATAHLAGLLGVSPFRPPLGHFAPVGDEHGLFILVSTGRIWHPDTGVPATEAPLEVDLSVDGQRFRLQYPGLTVS